MATELLLTTQSSNPQQVTGCFWDYSNGNVLQIYKNGGGASQKSLAIAGTDYIITSEQSKPLLHVWPLNSQEPLKNHRFVLPGTVNCLALCPKSTYLAAGINSKLYVWELCSGKLLTVQQVHYQPITCMKFASSGGFLVIAGVDGMVVTYSLVDLISARNRFKAQSELGQVDPLYKRMDHSLPINDLFINKFSFKSRFATVSTDQTLRLYQLINGQLLLTLIFNRPLTAVIFDSPSHNIFVGDDHGLISRYDLTSPPRTMDEHIDDRQTDSVFVGHKGKITCLDINVFNNRLASAAEDCAVLVWDLVSRQVLKKIELKSAPSNLRFVLTAAHMFQHNRQPAIVLNSLERNVEVDLMSTIVSVVQRDDFNICEDANERRRAEEKDAVHDLQAQVMNLQKINLDLFMELQKYKSGSV